MKHYVVVEWSNDSELCGDIYLMTSDYNNALDKFNQVVDTDKIDGLCGAYANLNRDLDLFEEGIAKDFNKGVENITTSFADNKVLAYYHVRKDGVDHTCCHFCYIYLLEFNCSFGKTYLDKLEFAQENNFNEVDFSVARAIDDALQMHAKKSVYDIPSEDYESLCGSLSRYYLEYEEVSIDKFADVIVCCYLVNGLESVDELGEEDFFDKHIEFVNKAWELIQ